MFAGRNMMFVMGAAGSSSPPPSGTASLSLTWEDNSAIEDGYRLRYRTAGSGSYTLGTTTAANATSGTIAGLAFGTNYDVTVAAFNGSGEYSVVGPVTRYTPPEFAPTSLSATATLSTSITVGFTAAAGVTSYQGYYRVTGSSTWLVGPAITSGASINFMGLYNLTSYEFKIKGFFTNPSPQAPSYSPDSATLTASTVLLSIGWNGEHQIAPVGDTIVNTTGTLVSAVALGDAPNYTVNGVTFLGQNTIGNLDSVFFSTELYANGVIGANFTQVMRHLAYVSGSADAAFALTGFIPGDTYLLQVFSSDDRAGFNNRLQAFTIAGHTSPAMTVGNSFAATCVFVASASSHTLTISDPDGLGACQLQAYQLRKL